MDGKLLERSDMYSVFGCAEFEGKVLNVINKALSERKVPSFKSLKGCSCRHGVCCKTEATILLRLRKTGVWAKIEEILSLPPTDRLTANLLARGGIMIEGMGVFPYISGMKQNQIDDALFEVFPKGWVTFVEEECEYILFRPEGRLLLDVKE